MPEGSEAGERGGVGGAKGVMRRGDAEVRMGRGRWRLRPGGGGYAMRYLVCMNAYLQTL